MKSKLIIISLLFLFTGISAEAQLLEKLKQRAEEKGLETKDVSLDTTFNAKNRTTSFEQEELQINSAQEFFNKDVTMALYNENGQLVQTSYFDKEAIAMRIKKKDVTKPLYQDRQGKLYGFNDDEGYYEKVSILPPSSMGFMMAGMIPQAYKLPPEPYLEAYTAIQELDLTISYLVLELAFIYKPSHFMDDDNYTLQNIAFPDVCLRFNYNDPDYVGSYIQFDDNDRLVEFFITSTNPQYKTDNPTGKFVFSYQDCSVKLPDALEQSMVPGPLGKILPLEKGLEPWKHNKKDKQNKNNK